MHAFQIFMQRKKWRNVYIDMSLFKDLTNMSEAKALQIIVQPYLACFKS